MHPAAEPDTSPDMSAAATSPLVPELPAVDPPPPVTTVHVAHPAVSGGGGGGGGGKRKKTAISKKRVAEIEEKISALSTNFSPVAFSPKTVADVAAHERLFRALGLWDFVRLPLDSDIRSDLLLLLVAHYDPPNRRSTVNGRRIAVSRADLARALSLPVKKDKSFPLPDPRELQLLSSDVSIGVIMEFIMKSIFLLDDEAFIMPKEFVSVSQLVKEGQAHKIDWAGLLWNLVERELVEAPKHGQCNYASYLQCLLKHQRPELFLEEVKADQELEAGVEVEVDGEPLLELAPVEEDDDAGDGMRIMKFNEIPHVEDDNIKNHSAGLCLGLAGDAVKTNDIDECKVDEENKQGIAVEKNQGMLLRRCNMKNNDVGTMECADSIKDDEGVEVVERDEGTYNDDAIAKFSLETFTSTDLLNTMDVSTDSYGRMTHQVGPSSGEFLNMSHDMQKNMVLDPESSGLFLYRNDGKRRVSDMEEEGDGLDPFAQDDHQPKRMRGDGQWDFGVSSIGGCMENVKREVGMCMEIVNREISKAQMISAEKENELANARLQIQYLNEMLLQKDQFIQSFEKERLEEKHRTESQYCHFEHEFRVLGRLVIGYKRALKDTRAAFAEYRKKFPQGDKPLYKDVPGGGGLVLSVRELERLRLQKDQELRQVAVDLSNIFEEEWLLKLNGHKELLSGLNERWLELHRQFQHLKETATKLKQGGS